MINFVDHKSFNLSSGTNDHAETVITLSHTVGAKNTSSCIIKIAQKTRKYCSKLQKITPSGERPIVAGG